MRRSAGDDELLKMATRIKARAVRRLGELLKQIEPNKGGRPSETPAGEYPSFSPGDAARDGKWKADDHPPTRSDAAREAGKSPHQQKQAAHAKEIRGFVRPRRSSGEAA